MGNKIEGNKNNTTIKRNAKLQIIPYSYNGVQVINFIGCVSLSSSRGRNLNELNKKKV